MTDSPHNAPKISVSFTADGDHLTKVTLQLATKFSYHIENASLALEKTLHQWISAYLNKTHKPFHIPEATSFRSAVWAELSKVPFGTTISYGNLARQIDNPRAARAIGNACNANPLPLIIPCHRVVHADQSIGGFALDLEIKRRLLAFEQQ